ncbi:MAG TPA: prolipoprotein diacylglyceryl transferase family protein [Candidatus Sulfomarinibacteraceae bacterium]|nr:prolipoprotein diacylglyceryl transferase family protein [Candidatus Sulfomarinibacteraceae bacterium]
MAPAVITLAFDPILRLGGLEVRAQTVALAGILLVALLLAAWIGRTRSPSSPLLPGPGTRVAHLPVIVLGIVPGAVIGGRLDYVLVHLDFYLEHPGAIADPAQGGLSLGLAVLGGLLGGVAMTRLVDAPAGRWVHAATIPALLALAAGKLAGVLAGEGQGIPSDLPWATAFTGAGPWASLAPDVPSHPSQVYEAIATTLVLLVIGIALRLGAFRRRDGSAFLAAISLWAIGRSVVAVTWRDAAVQGPLNAEQLILLGMVVACGMAIVVLDLRRRSAPPPLPDPSAPPAWPDPTTRPRF